MPFPHSKAGAHGAGLEQAEASRIANSEASACPEDLHGSYKQTSKEPSVESLGSFYKENKGAFVWAALP